MRYSISKTIALLILGFVPFLGSAQISVAAEKDANDNVVFSTEGTPLLNGEMDGDRGAFGINTNTLTSEQTLAATSAGNSLNVYGNQTNGNIGVGDNFRSGFGSYVMNTGNNTAISSAVTVNVQILPSP